MASDPEGDCSHIRAEPNPESFLLFGRPVLGRAPEGLRAWRSLVTGPLASASAGRLGWGRGAFPPGGGRCPEPPHDDPVSTGAWDDCSSFKDRHLLGKSRTAGGQVDS